MDYSISIADLELEADDVKGFWAENFPGWPQDKYAMFYVNNPSGQATCWIVREPEANKVIGANAIIPRKLYINNKHESAAIVVDFGVNIKHRGQGSAQLLQNTLVEYHNVSDLGFLYATPNVVSEKVFRRADFDIIGKYQRMVKILDTKRYIKKVVKSASLAKIIAGPVNMILRKSARENSQVGNDQFKVESPDRFDERFDRLWQDAKQNYTIIGERSSQFLNWRFSDCPYLDYKIMALVQSDSDRLVGYVVYRVSEGDVYIEDIFALDTDNSLSVLLAEFSLFNRKRAVETISCYFFGNEKVINMFQNHNFLLRKDHHVMAVRVNTKSKYATEIRERNNWFFLNGDNDGASETERYSG